MAILQTGRITKTQIANQSFANVYRIIDNRSNVKDPVYPNSTTKERKFVYSKLPHILSTNFLSKKGGFPFIVMSRTKPKKRKSTADLSKSQIDYDIFITVYSQNKKTDSDGYEEGSDLVQGITDDILKTLEDPSNRKTWINQGMGDLVFDVDVDEETIKGQTLFVTSLDVRFEKGMISVG